MMLFVSVKIGVKEKNTDYSLAIKQYWDDEWFREVIKLYIGNLSNSGNRKWANEIVEDVIKNDESIEHLILAGEAFKDLNEDLRDEIVLDSLRKRYWSEINGNISAVEKNQLGKLIGAIGDDRNLKEFISTEKNLFILEGSINDDTCGENGFEIDAFGIGKYLINKAWYAEFMDNDGYKKEEYWSTDGWCWRDKNGVVEPLFWSKEGFNCQNFPIVGISLYEAEAFCIWLTKQENDNSLYRLPYEMEWQAAAAGIEARKYPWGGEDPKERANYESVGIGGISTVGLFKKGDTVDQISDMAGNVWEWTKSSSSVPDHRLDRYYIRGGAWNYPETNLNCKDRNFVGPDTRTEFLGFRCVRVAKEKARET